MIAKPRVINNFQNWSLVAVIIALTCGLLYSVFRPVEQYSKSVTWDYPEYSSCEKEVLSELHLEKANFLVLQNTAELCFAKLQDQSYITIFDVNRGKYLEQNFEDRVLLWMVVAITLSGVILAGLQLGASFKLASEGKAEFAKDSDFTLQKDRLSAKSSVTGLLILLISLGFFIIYVKYVYKIDNAADVASTPPMASSMTRSIVLDRAPPLPRPATTTSVADNPVGSTVAPAAGTSPPTASP
jgi:hypothetical protein